MYFGHFAVAIAIKAKYKDVPILPIMLGAGFLDVMNGILVGIGVEHVSPNLAALPYLYFDLDFIDWDHSLLMAIVWSFIWGAFFIKDKGIACVAALSCFLHFVADIPMHNADLAVYPYAELYLGLGLWGKWGIYSWLFEIGFSALLLAYAYRSHLKVGEDIRWQIGLIAILALQMSPWTSPMKFGVMWFEREAYLFYAVMVVVGFIVPTLILSKLYQRSTRRANVKN